MQQIDTESLLKRIEQLESRVTELESKLAAKKNAVAVRGRGRPSTIDDEIIAAVNDLLKKGKSVRQILAELKMSRAKYYAILERIKCSEKSSENQNNQNAKKSAEALVDEIRKTVFFNGTLQPTAKTWNGYFKKVSEYVTSPVRRYTLTGDEVYLAVRTIFDGFLKPQSNRQHAKKLGNLLVNFQRNNTKTSK